MKGRTLTLDLELPLTDDVPDEVVAQHLASAKAAAIYAQTLLQLLGEKASYDMVDHCNMIYNWSQSCAGEYGLLATHEDPRSIQ